MESQWLKLLLDESISLKTFEAGNGNFDEITNEDVMYEADIHDDKTTTHMGTGTGFIQGSINVLGDIILLD